METYGALIVTLGLASAIYFIPGILANSRKINNEPAVWIVNLFLGWTLIGWVAALAMAASGATKVEVELQKKRAEYQNTLAAIAIKRKTDYS